MSAIGIEVTNGGLLEMMDLLMGGQTSPLRGRWATIENKWLKRHIDLREVLYGEGDWSSYDQTLAVSVLAAALGVPLTAYSEDKLHDPLLALLLAIAHGSNVTKVMYVYMTNMFYRVQGRMFSGVLVTSTMDTVYQMILVFYYFSLILKKYPGDELLQDILSSWMMIFFFYGDDHVCRWPKVMSRYMYYADSRDSLDDFVQVCIKKLGMKYKLEASKRFENPIGEIHFIEKNGRYREVSDLTVVGLSFLKFHCVQVWVNGQKFREVIPMKLPADGPAKLGFGMQSSGNLTTEAAKVLALAHLNTNLELHQQYESYYKRLVKNGAVVDGNILKHVVESADSNSMFLLSQSIRDWNDVSFPDVMKNYDKQYDGYLSGSGFCPSDVYGNKILGDDKHQMWFR